MEKNKPLALTEQPDTPTPEMAEELSNGKGAEEDE